ncbi:hypothetical protein YUYDRAFT_07359 [Streptomyces sp. ScaeMP-e48]|nr:hypothetical protein YUYDRAFT_07359 [Streptomyces sp. ScaeMP-e48]
MKKKMNPPPELIKEARNHPNGWVYEIDSSLIVDPTGYVPPTAIVRAWEVDNNGNLTGSHRDNPNYNK